jgi:ABC-type branched-subunit amino acid transport system ATPase component
MAAVSRVSLELRRGEVVGLIGPNGSGKTTLVNLIAGVLALHEGSLQLGDQLATTWSTQRRCHWGLARTRQVALPLTQMTVFENVVVGALFGATQYTSYRAAEAIASRTLDELGMAALADALPTELPIQKLKILEIARALATQPRALLLDESMAGLGAGESHTILELIKEKRRAGLGIVVIEHRVPDLISIADRMVVLHAGTLLAQGAPDDVINDPEVMRVYMGIGEPVAMAPAGAENRA